MNKILAIVAHPDDEALGVCGTLIRHAQAGDEVYLCVMCGRVKYRADKPTPEQLKAQIHAAGKIIGIKDTVIYNFPNVEMNTVPIIKLVQAVEKVLTKWKPDIIYTHFWGDLNDDHKKVFEAVTAAEKMPERHKLKDFPINKIKKIYCFETPGSTGWAPQIPQNMFMPNTFVNITEEIFEKKNKALKQYGEVLITPHPRSTENIFALAKYRGSQVGFKFAEAFILLKRKIK